MSLTGTAHYFIKATFLRFKYSLAGKHKFPFPIKRMCQDFMQVMFATKIWINFASKGMWQTLIREVRSTSMFKGKLCLFMAEKHWEYQMCELHEYINVQMIKSSRLQMMNRTLTAAALSFVQRRSVNREECQPNIGKQPYKIGTYKSNILHSSHYMNCLNLNVHKQCTSCVIYTLDKRGVSGMGQLCICCTSRL